MAPDSPIQGDRIEIQDLRLRCIVGMNPEERETKQDVLIRLVLYVDLKAAGESDNIKDTVNYWNVEQAVIALVESSSYLLLERMAEMISRTCLSFGGVRAVSVRVEKPGALRFARSVGVEIHREPSRDKEKQ